MSLQKYKTKRNFEQTPEPKARIKKSKSKFLKFYIQKHHARRLHYDFRLELNGVLKSWAVPKGPSLDPQDKRLAIHVEDHPLEYGDFEGLIPKGHYGAGEVKLWDKGIFFGVKHLKRNLDEKDLMKQLKDGELKFVLSGKKLKGEFVLIKLKKNDSDDNHWLLIKTRNNKLQSNEPIKVLEKNSNKKIIKTETVNLTKKSSKIRSKNSKIHSLYEEGSKAPMPHHIRPMLATLLDKAFNNPDWLFEIKWDGYRALAEINNQKISLYSRNLKSFNEKFPTVIEELKTIKQKMILDGELVIIDKHGVSQFQLLQNYLNNDRKNQGVLRYMVFDILYYDNHDLRNLPLINRRKILDEILTHYSLEIIQPSQFIEKRGIALFKEAKKNKIEGIIAKNKLSTYVEKRSQSWLKIKTELRQEAVIVGFTDPKGGRKKFGALVLGVYKKGKLNFIGLVGTGFNQQSLSALHKQLLPLKQKLSPLSDLKSLLHTTWVKPQLVCEISFRQWTKDMIMRQPVFKGLRLDKKPTEVNIEKEKVLVKLNKRSKIKVENANNSINQYDNLQEKYDFISNVEKVYWPHEGYTKGDLLNYYDQIHKTIIPYLKDRPMVLNRFPEGIEGPNFFQKEAPHFVPTWMKTTEIAHHHKKEKTQYMVIENAKSLLYIVNLGSIELNPFLSRIKTLNYPDYMVIDLDPENIAFKYVVEIALGCHEFLQKYKIPNYCKTSGKRGLHILIPLGAKYNFEKIKYFAQILATLIHQQFPKISSIIRDPIKRQKKVYIDYLQNSRTKSIVAPYSVRPIRNAMVSTPLDWKELKSDLDPKTFNMFSVPERIRIKGDLLKPILKQNINLEKLLLQLEDDFKENS